MKKPQEVIFEQGETMTTFTIEDPLSGDKIIIPMKNEHLLSLSTEKLCQIISAIIEQELKNK